MNQDYHFHFDLASMIIYAISTAILWHLFRVLAAKLGQQGGSAGKLGVGLGGLFTFGGS